VSSAASPGPDHGPRPISTPPPAYPPEDLKARLRGEVSLSVLVSEEGVPIDVVVVKRARGRLTEAAVEAVRRWRFQPASRDGKPVRARTTVVIPFEAIPYPTVPAGTATPTPPPPGATPLH